MITDLSPEQRWLCALHDEFDSWQAVAGALGCDRGLLCRIANGRQDAPRSVADALRRYRKAQKPAPPAWVVTCADFLAAQLERKR